MTSPDLAASSLSFYLAYPGSLSSWEPRHLAGEQILGIICRACAQDEESSFLSTCIFFLKNLAKLVLVPSVAGNPDILLEHKARHHLEVCAQSRESCSLARG